MFVDTLQGTYRLNNADWKLTFPHISPLKWSLFRWKMFKLGGVPLLNPNLWGKNENKTRTFHHIFLKILRVWNSNSRLWIFVSTKKRKTVIPQTTNMAMENNYIFKWFFFHCYVCFLGCNTNWNLKLLLMEEILHRLIGSLPHYLQGFIHPRWCRISSTNSMIENPPKSWYPLGWSAYLGFLFEANHVDKCGES